MLNPDDIPVTKDRVVDRRTVDIGGPGLRGIPENVATMLVASNLGMIQRYGKIFEMELVGDAAPNAQGLAGDFERPLSHFPAR
jgi:hypothetical protein